eukprot:5448551-Pyramimonas_sp.AAC.1
MGKLGIPVRLLFASLHARLLSSLGKLLSVQNARAASLLRRSRAVQLILTICVNNSYQLFALHHEQA